VKKWKTNSSGKCIKEDWKVVLQMRLYKTIGHNRSKDTNSEPIQNQDLGRWLPSQPNCKKVPQINE